MKIMRWALLTAAIAAATPGLGRAGCSDAVVSRTQPYTVGTIGADHRLLEPVDSDAAVAGRVVLGDGSGGVFIGLESSKYAIPAPGGCDLVVYADVLRISRRQLQDWGYSGYVPVWKNLIPQIPGHPILGLAILGHGERDAITDKKKVLKILVSLSKASARNAGERARALAENLAR